MNIRRMQRDRRDIRDINTIIVSQTLVSLSLTW